MFKLFCFWHQLKRHSVVFCVLHIKHSAEWELTAWCARARNLAQRKSICTCGLKLNHWKNRRFWESLVPLLQGSICSILGIIFLTHCHFGGLKPKILWRSVFLALVLPACFCWLLTGLLGKLRMKLQNQAVYGAQLSLVIKLLAKLLANDLMPLMKLQNTAPYKGSL